MLHNPNWDKNSISSILMRAADLLEQRGHIKDRLIAFDPHTNKPVGMCIMGAINMAHHGDAGFEDVDITYAAAAVIQKTMGIMMRAKDNYPYAMASAVVDWNNAPKRTAEQVIAALRLASIEAAKVS